jgi:purine-binding chemotaxis protein CheW
MRPLPIEPLAAMPGFILGLSIIRGTPTPVVDARRLVGADPTYAPTRFLTLKIEDRRVALAVDAVVGIRDLATQGLVDLPPLLHEADRGVVSAIGTLDSGLLLVLRGARVVPQPVWQALKAGAPRP